MIVTSSSGIWKRANRSGRSASTPTPSMRSPSRADGASLATASGDRTVKVWDVASGRRLVSLGDATAELYAVAFGPDGSSVLAGGVDRTIRRWALDGDDGRLVNSAIAHDAAVLRLLVAPDGQTIYSTGEDAAVKAWSLPGLDPLYALPTQPDWPLAAALSPAGDRIALGRYDGSLVVRPTSADGEAITLLEAPRPDEPTTAPPEPPKPELTRRPTLGPPAPKGAERGETLTVHLGRQRRRPGERRRLRRPVAGRPHPAERKPRAERTPGRADDRPRRPDRRPSLPGPDAARRARPAALRRLRRPGGRRGRAERRPSGDALDRPGDARRRRSTGRAISTSSGSRRRPADRSSWSTAAAALGSALDADLRTERREGPGARRRPSTLAITPRGRRPADVPGRRPAVRRIGESLLPDRGRRIPCTSRMPSPRGVERGEVGDAGRRRAGTWMSDVADDPQRRGTRDGPAGPRRRPRRPAGRGGAPAGRRRGAAGGRAARGRRPRFADPPADPRRSLGTDRRATGMSTSSPSRPRPASGRRRGLRPADRHGGRPGRRGPRRRGGARAPGRPAAGRRAERRLPRPQRDPGEDPPDEVGGDRSRMIIC